MKTTTRFSFLLAIGSVLFFSAQAGDLEPPGPPAPTMVTLQEIYDLVQSQGAGGAAVPKTGQTECWDEFGTSIPCAGTGQDGEYQAGVSVDPRLTDNGDGTVSDNLTGLIWFKSNRAQQTRAIDESWARRQILCRLDVGAVLFRAQVCTDEFKLQLGPRYNLSEQSPENRSY